MWKANTKSMLRKRKRIARNSESDSDVEEERCESPAMGDLGLFDAMMQKQGVRIEDNHIYLYTDVSQRSMESLVKAIRELNCDLGAMTLRYGIEPCIYLHINSDGGEVYPALAAVDTIMSSRIPVVTIVEGCVASAATLLSIAGSERRMSKHSHMLIHEVRSSFWGKMNQIEEEMTNLDKLMSMIVDIYKTQTTMKDAEIRRILRKDEMWDAAKCLKKGLVDTIGM